MNTPEVIKAIEVAAATHTISKADVVAAYERGAGKRAAGTGVSRRVNIADILYYIGGAIVCIGIAVLLWQNWEDLSDATRLLATLGVGLVAYVVGLLLSRQVKYTGVATAFYLISAIVTTIGLYVAFDIGSIAITNQTHTLIMALLLAMYGTSWFLFRNIVFLIFTIIFGTLFFFAATSALVENYPTVPDFEFVAYRFLVVGLSFILLGYSFVATKYKELTATLYGIGLVFFLSAALALGEWKPNQNIFWELIFPGLVFAVLFLSVYLKSRSFLVFGAIYLMAYIIKITAEYFTDSLGWPLALVLAGLALIGIGYFTVYMNRRYLKTATPVA